MQTWSIGDELDLHPLALACVVFGQILSVVQGGIHQHLVILSNLDDDAVLGNCRATRAIHDPDHGRGERCRYESQGRKQKPLREQHRAP